MKSAIIKILKSPARGLTAFIVGFGLCEMVHASYGFSLIECFLYKNPTGIDMRIMKTEMQILKSEMSHLQFQLRETLDACNKLATVSDAAHSNDSAGEQFRREREEQIRQLQAIQAKLHRLHTTK